MQTCLQEMAGKLQSNLQSPQRESKRGRLAGQKRRVQTCLQELAGKLQSNLQRLQRESKRGLVALQKQVGGMLETLAELQEARERDESRPLLHYLNQIAMN